jgi:hypothetical protein
MVNTYCEICHQFDGCKYPQCPSRNAQQRSARCPGCNRDVFLVHPTTASACLGIDPKTLWRRRKRGRVTDIQQEGGRPLIIWSSLFRPELPPLLRRTQIQFGREDSHQTRNARK